MGAEQLALSPVGLELISWELGALLTQREPAAIARIEKLALACKKKRFKFLKFFLGSPRAYQKT